MAKAAAKKTATAKKGPAFGTAEWRKKHGMPVKKAAGKAPAKKATKRS